MAFLIDIGAGLVGKLVDYTVVRVGREVGYLIYYNRNVKSLQDQLDVLVAASQSVEVDIVAEKRNIREADAPVNQWLTDVKKITEEANKEILKEEHVKKKWLCGLCPNLVVRHQISRRSTELVDGISDLRGKCKDFSKLTHPITPQDVPTNDYEDFGSRISVVNQVMDVLRNSPDIGMIGVYGIGGVGKTTLVKEVARQATGDKTLFDDVALILDVKQNPSIQRIQKEIAEKLGLEFPESETTAGRARRVSSRIKDQKTLVILDDVWERIDLEAVGLSGLANCKVLLTSRSREVLSREMHSRKEFPLDLLGEEETWSLFKKKAGDVIKDPDIKAVAIKVAKRCGGLPVLVVTVASALKNRSTLHAWKDALTRLKKFEKEEFTEKTYLALEWSYSQLNDEELKQIFLLCGLLSKSSKIIYIHDLFKYGIGLGLFRNLNTMGEAWDALNTRLERLKDSCLLLDNERSQWAKMHDLVHDVANRILLRDQHVWKVTDGDEFEEWPDNKDFFDKCSMISLRTSNIPKLPEVLQCKELQLFHISTGVKDYDIDIPVNFFQKTKKLRALVVSSLSIPSLPPSLEFLQSLKTLCLDWCSLGDISLLGKLQDLEILSFLGSDFKELPKEIGQLTRLRLLDLKDCSQLKLISPGVISNLGRLEELRMGNSFNRWGVEGIIITEKINASLSELKHLSKLSTLYVHISDARILPSNLFSDALERFQICIGATWNWNDEDEDLNKLKIKLTAGNELYQSGLYMLLKRTDELHLDGTEAGNNSAYQLDGEAFQQLKHLHVHNAEFRHIIYGKGVSHNLKKLAVGGLNGSRFLLTSSMASSLVQLTNLVISGCQTMEEIVSVNESDEKHMKDMFPKLQHLKLVDLPILTRFCSRSYTGNPSLEILQPENDNEIEEMDFREEFGNALFDEKVVFQILKRLIISGLTKIMTIWQNRLSQENFRNLETLKIKSCKSLKSVFPCSMVTNFEQLMNLEVIDCGVEEIVANEDGLVQATPQFVFPKVVSVKFWNLPHLCCFYPGMHASWWPSLEALTVEDCFKVAFLAQECSSFERNHETSVLPTPTNQALFLINKDSFPNLKTLVIFGMEIWEGPLTVNFFSKLEIFQEGEKHSESAAILEKFPNAVGAIPHLNKLWLYGMPKLMHLGEDNSQIAGQNFPNLKILGIEGCGSLRNLRSSAISFKNLTHLIVFGCPELEYLINYSTAKSLMQLTYLRVEGCTSLVEIVRSTEDNDDSGNEIVFSRLTDLQLSNLPKLRGFCSIDHCTVEFPLLKTLSISKRLKLKIFHYNETLLLTNEEDDTDIDSDDGDTDIASDDVDSEFDFDDGQTDVDSDVGETVAEENVDIDTGGDGEQIDEITHITNQKEAENCDRSVTTKNVDCIKNREQEKKTDSDADREEIGESAHITNKITEVTFDGSEHVQALEITATDDQGVIAAEEENSSIIPVGEITTSVFPVIESPPFCEVEGEQRFSGPKLEPLAEEARHIEEQSEPYEPSAAATETPTPITRTLAPPSSSKSSGSTRSLNEKFQALSTEKVDIVQTGANCEEIDETTHVMDKNTEANFDGPELVQPLKTTVTHQRVKAFGISCLLFGLFMWISFILYFQGVTSPILEENIAIIPVGEFTTVFPVIEPSPFVVAPHTEEVGKQAFSGPNLEPLDEDATSDVHQVPNAPNQHVTEQSDHFEPSAAVTDAPTPIIPALPPPSPPKSSGVKPSLREKLQALSAKKAASSSGLPEEVKTKLKALIATANLKEPHTRQQLLALLSSLQLSTTKWIADLAVQDLSKLQLVLDKEESLCQELAALIAQDAKLDVRSHMLLSEGNLAEENIQKVQEHKVELLDIEEQIKKLEARATSLRDVIALLEKSYSGFEASLDQLVKEHQLNQLSVDSTSQELLRTRAESDSLCTAIFTYLGQLL